MTTACQLPPPATLSLALSCCFGEWQAALVPKAESRAFKAEIRLFGDQITDFERSVSRKEWSTVLISLTTIIESGKSLPEAAGTAQAHLSSRKFRFPFPGSLERMSSILGRGPQDPTVIHRNRPKGRPSLNTIKAGPVSILDEQPSSSVTPSDSQSSKNSSGKSPNDSTGKTSLDSKFQASSSGKGNHNTNSSERKQQQSNQVNPSASPDGSLATIEETTVDPIIPSVVTVERAAAAKDIPGDLLQREAESPYTS